MTQTAFTFGGATYDPVLDRERLTTQLQRVQRLMADGCWRTLHEIQEAVGGTEASISARLRDCRKSPWFLRVDRRRVADGGLWEYRVLPRESVYPD